MEIFIQILSVIVAILLIGVVLIQKSKGGGLSSSFAGSNQIMGVRRTNDFIEKATWVLASIICILAIASAFVVAPEGNEDGLKSTDAATTAPAPASGQYDSEAKPAATDAKATEAPAAPAATDAKATETPAIEVKANEAPAATAPATPVKEAKATEAAAPAATPVATEAPAATPAEPAKK